MAIGLCLEVMLIPVFLFCTNKAQELNKPLGTWDVIAWVAQPTRRASLYAKGEDKVLYIEQGSVPQILLETRRQTSLSLDGELRNIQVKDN
ncbi:hypothetical protein J6590_028666 [Homalodisca vitripennis]|nr:hypothetical protein J6590_028666 [Homalodisca vitripennis]